MKLHRFLAIVACALTLAAAGCAAVESSAATEKATLPAASPSGTQEEDTPAPAPESTEKATRNPDIPADAVRIHVVDSEGREATFALNESKAAETLLMQLPLNANLDDYSTNEKIFYPLEKLDTSDAPPASGMAGTLAYYEPWGDVVLFYDAYATNDALFEIGRIESGFDELSSFTGPVRVEMVDEH